MRKVAVSCLAAVAVACSSEQVRPPSAGAETVLVGRVVASREIVTFVGDLAYDSYAHAVVPRDSPRSRLIVVSAQEDCPAPGNSDQLYQMTVQETEIKFGITSQEDQRWLTKFQVISCSLLDR